MKLNIQATATQINNLVAIVQAAPSEYDHDKAIYALWDIFGNYFMALVAKKSYLIDSDFSLNGYSPAERKANLAGNAYMLFCKAVTDFDPSRKVPFAAYIAKIGEWRMLDEKRKNAKRKAREELERDAKYNDCDEEPYSRINNCDMNPFTGERNFLECDFEKEDSIVRIRKCLAADPKALRKFDIMYELCCSGEYSDAEAARRIGCERANMKNVKNSIRLMLINSGLEYDCGLLMAA